RLAREPAVVQRRDGDVRHLVGRLQQPADRRAAPAEPEGDHHPLLHRRPLLRRRPLRRLLPPRRGRPLVGIDDARIQRAPAGPAIEFLQESLRWWDYWLKGIDTGIMDEPAVRVWMQESIEPRPYYDERPGCWVTEPSWPSPHVEVEARPLELPASTLVGAQEHGLLAGDWCPYGASEELPPDQRAEDGLCLCWTGA